MTHQLLVLFYVLLTSFGIVLLAFLGILFHIKHKPIKNNLFFVFLFFLLYFFLLFSLINSLPQKNKVIPSPKFECSVDYKQGGRYHEI